MATPSDLQSLHLVYLVNFLAPDQVAIWQEIAARVAKVTILVSVAMEANRDWKTDDGGLDVRRQRTWTISRTIRHSAGHRDVNYVHLPLDTGRQLARLRPDVVVSSELGFRSLAASRFCRLRGAAHIVAVSTSEHVDEYQGRLRTRLRKRLLDRADRITYHGPSCRRFVEKFDVSPDKLMPFDYAADPNKPYRGELLRNDGETAEAKLLTVGQLIQRKGVRDALDQLCRWSDRHPEYKLTWTLVGSGPLYDSLKIASTPSNLRILLTGHQNEKQIRDHYRDSEVLLFPTLADEWGLVVDEALMSGLAVIGSRGAQSVETLVRDGINGWTFPAGDQHAIGDSLENWLKLDRDERVRMRQRARESASNRTPASAAGQLMRAIESIRDCRANQ